MSENWRAVPGFPGYLASSEGRVMGPMGHPLGFPSRDGYVRVCIRQDGQKRSLSAHSLVALAFIGPRPEGLQIDHIDCNRANNRPENLRYVTAAENMARLRYDDSQRADARALRAERARAAAAGRPKKLRPGPPLVRGSDNGRAILTEPQVLEILATYDPVGRRGTIANPKPNSLKALAKKFGVTKAAIVDIVHGKNWRHIPREPSTGEGA